MSNNEGGSEPKDEHGCIIGKEVWDETAQKCVPKPAAAGADAIKNKIARMSMDEKTATLTHLMTAVIPEKDALIKDLTKQLDEINKVVESDQKAQLISEILPRSSFKIDDLVGKNLEELKNIRATLDQAMPPKVNSVRFGVQAADLSDKEKGLTVGDLSFSTAQKRKANS